MPTCLEGEGGPNATCLPPPTTAARREVRARVLGGEVSMWSDHYCATKECHAVQVDAAHPAPCAWFLSGRNHSLGGEFARSVLAMLYPKVGIAAGAFWHYDERFSLEHGSELWRRLAVLALRLRRRGVNGCPLLFGDDDCREGCTEAAFCGKPYEHAASAKQPPLEPACPYHY